MALPPTVRVKLSSEAAGAISITPVVVQDLSIRELAGHMLAVAGKDEARLIEILLRGWLVIGASRLRWAGFPADPESLRELLASFPDPDPALAFAPARCVRAALIGGRQPIQIDREAASSGVLFHRGGFWEELIGIVNASAPAYAGYSYRHTADRYRCLLTAGSSVRLRAAAQSLRHPTLRARIQSERFEAVEAYTAR
jgi:acyl dehydratase